MTRQLQTILYFIILILLAVLLFGCFILKHDKESAEIDKYSNEQNLAHKVENKSRNIVDDEYPIIIDILNELEVNQPVAKVSTKNWETYRNEKYGFDFKYPSSWFYIKDTSGAFKALSFETISPAKPFYEDSYYGMVSVNELKVNIKTYSTVDEGVYFKKYKLQKEMILIDNRVLFKAEEDSKGALDDRAYFFNNNDFAVIIEVLFEKNSDTKYQQDIIETILSTIQIQKEVI